MSGHLTSLIKPVGHEEHYHTSQDESHKDQCRCCIHADSLTGIQGGGYPCPCACPKTLFPAPAQVSDFATPGWRSWSCPKTHGSGQLSGRKVSQRRRPPSQAAPETTSVAPRPRGTRSATRKSAWEGTTTSFRSESRIAGSAGRWQSPAPGS